jgi:hypothetical protein
MIEPEDQPPSAANDNQPVADDKNESQAQGREPANDNAPLPTTEAISALSDHITLLYEDFLNFPARKVLLSLCPLGFPQKTLLRALASLPFGLLTWER